MLKKRTWLLLLLVLVLRLLLLGWDSGATSSSPHPDERQVAYVSERVSGWFDDPGFYAYGSLHFQAVRAATSLIGLGSDARALLLGGRVLSLGASLLAILIGWALAHRAWGRRTGELFLVLAAWIPLDLQQSHFATVEAHHSVWVVFALAACFWLASKSSTGAAAAAGAAVGASLAVKVASLALGLPLGVALVLVLRRRDPLEAVRLGAVAAGSGAAAFWLCQPWAFADGAAPLALLAPVAVMAAAVHFAIQRTGFARMALLGLGGLAGLVAALQTAALLGAGGSAAAALGGSPLNPDYLRGVGEQVAMVMGRADLPYVRVYHGTLSVLYPLRELTLWGLGPLLLATIIAAGAGVVRVTRRLRRWFEGRWSNGAVLLLILLAWAIPMTVRLSTLQVKYLRYWEPLVVPGAMLAAWWLMRLPKRLRRRTVAAVIAGTVVWGLAYLWAFVDPHPHRTAALWLDPMIETGQVVAYEHWDETLNLHPEGGPVERIDLPSYDLPDDADKTLQWCRQLARADWVILTSNRVRRTVLVNPERFPRTGRLYRLLLAGEAGFEPLARVSRGPRIFGLRWPIQRADESFVNYDFPQVVILRRVAEVSPEALSKRVSRPLPYLESLGSAALDRRYVNPLPEVIPVPSGVRQVVDVVIWGVVFAALGIAAWALLFPALRRWPDAGVGLALATGWVAPAWLMWFGNELGLWPTGTTTASWIFLVVLAAGTLTLGARWREAMTTLKHRRAHVVRVLAVAAAVGFLFLSVRLFNPAVHWGEKPMDFSFLNNFVNAPAWPPGEPWMAGMPLHYYYFGEVLATFPIQVAGCTTAVGYNLISSTIPALGAAVLAGFGLLLCRRRRWGAAALLPVLVLLTGNLEWLWELDLARAGRWFDMWWATSRVIPGFAIDEYPLWTALFADLHGHFIALPVFLMTLAWGWLCVHQDGRRWISAAALCGIGTAVLVATNPWDLFVLTAALGLGTLVGSKRPLVGIGRLSVAAGVSLVAAAPFVVELVEGISAGAGARGLFLTQADFAPAWAVLHHFGPFLIPLAVLALVVLGRRGWVVVPTAVAGVVAGLAFGSSAAALALALTALFAIAALRSCDRLTRLGWALAALGTLAVAACERFTLIDRMNTLFKVYNGVWVLLAVALGAMLLRERGRRRTLLLAVWLPVQAIAMVNLPLGIAQGWLQPRMVSPRPTLDGQAFLAEHDPQTRFLVRTLQGTALPGEAVAEAAGTYYSRFTRIAMHTGQPTVIGWEWHLKQRGQDPFEIASRFADLETLYAGKDPLARRAVLDRYRVGWVVLADVERDRYGLQGADPLAGVPGLLRLAEHEGALLYRVLPPGAAPSEPITPAVELPAGVGVVGMIPVRSATVVRSLDLDDNGATVVLRDGVVLDLDLTARGAAVLDPPPCDPRSVVRRGEERWTICADGRLWRRLQEGAEWSGAGRLRGAANLSSADELWAWGDSGLWKFQSGANWDRISAGPVTAAAAAGPGIAWSDGRSVWVGRGESSEQVGRTLEGVRSLAWQGSVLWALDDDGLHKSGGAVLPWRPALEELGAVATAAGSSSRLWLVLPDGLLLEPSRTPCMSPWQSASTVPSGGLDEPRGIAVAPSGWFVVADTQNDRLRWYSKHGVCLDAAGSEGSGPGAFREPSGLALAADGTLAVADTWNGRVQLLRTDGSYQVLGGDLYGPRGLLWGPGSTLYVADTGNRRLVRYRPPAWRPELVVELPAPVVGLAWTAGLLAAAVPANGTIALVDPTEGAVVRHLEVPGWRGQDQQEGYLAVLPSGDLVASAPRTGELWLIDPTGTAAARLLRDGLPGITAVILLPDGQLLASQTWEDRLVRVAIEE